jgi:hypothetical protein
MAMVRKNLAITKYRKSAIFKELSAEIRGSDTIPDNFHCKSTLYRNMPAIPLKQKECNVGDKMIAFASAETSLNITFER